MSGMHRPTEAELIAAMARELLAHRRASQAAPAPSSFGMYGEYTPITVGTGTTVKTPAPQDADRAMLIKELSDAARWRRLPDNENQLATAVLFERAVAALTATPAPKCATCEDHGCVSTTDVDRDGNHIEIACPACAPARSDGLREAWIASRDAAAAEAFYACGCKDSIEALTPPAAYSRAAPTEGEA